MSLGRATGTLSLLNEPHFNRIQCKPHDVAVAPTQTSPGEESANSHDVAAAPLPDLHRVGAFCEERVSDSEAGLERRASRWLLQGHP